MKNLKNNPRIFHVGRLDQKGKSDLDGYGLGRRGREGWREREGKSESRGVLSFSKMSALSFPLELIVQFDGFGVEERTCFSRNEKDHNRWWEGVI